MNKLLILHFSILLIGCCNEPKLLNNGLTKKASKITEYSIKIEKDSLNKDVQDTLFIREKKYNKDDQISNLFQKTLFDGETLEIDYVYDYLNKIKTEIVKMSTDSIPYTVDYMYKDSLLHQAKGIVENSTERFEQIETYYYRKNGTIEKTVSTQTFIDFESSDTIRNSVSKSYFDKNELIERTETIYHTDSKRNQQTKFNYDCGLLIKTMEYNYKDSLISTTKWKYVFDQYDNWTKMKSIENGKLNYIKTREIEYK